MSWTVVPNPADQAILVGAGDRQKQYADDQITLQNLAKNKADMLIEDAKLKAGVGLPNGIGFDTKLGQYANQFLDDTHQNVYDAAGQYKGINTNSAVLPTWHPGYGGPVSPYPSPPTYIPGNNFIGMNPDDPRSPRVTGLWSSLMRQAAQRSQSPPPNGYTFQEDY
jgi:hypothetical protein